ncbi:MAG: DUF1631 domain-containing protein [Betaproteobacteria bacterium]|nr:DUF1631 domain-containing protein [Betaproteobacteria bacterium]
MSHINHCGEMAVKCLTTALAATLNVVKGELFELAEKSTDRSVQNLYLCANAQIHEKHGAMEMVFREQFIALVEKKLAGPQEESKPIIDFSALKLSLMDHNELEEKWVVGDIVKRMSTKCEEELRALTQRMGFLMSEPGLCDEDNPLSPDTIVQALRAACELMEIGYQTKTIVLRLIEKRLNKEVQTLYQEINQYLVSQGILPQIRHSYRKKMQSHMATQSFHVGDNARDQAAATPNEQGAAPSQRSDANELFVVLQKLISGASAQEINSALSSLWAGHTAVAGQPAGADFIEAGKQAVKIAEHSTSRGKLMASLTAMQQQSLPSAAAVVADGHETTPSAIVNVLHELRKQDVVANSNQVDVVTIDIIAMLFDYIFEDKGIHDSVKVLIGRLQIPILKIAILDKTFFSNKSHPGRRLLDAVAGAAVCFVNGVSDDEPLYQKIESLIDHVYQKFDTDIQLIATALADFEQFQASREAVSQEVAERTARALYEREKQEMARRVAVGEMARRISAADLPAPIVDMMRGSWRRVLERHYLDEGGCHAQFQAALEVVDMLLWSLKPKSNAGERKYLTAMLPALLQRIQAGMALVEVAEAEQKQFFAALVDCHAAAIKTRSDHALPQPATADTTPLSARTPTEAQGVAVPSAVAPESDIISPPLPSKAAEAPAVESTASFISSESQADDELAKPTQLTRGTWVEFDQSDGRKVHAKLSWVSPLKGVYLFTTSATAEAISVAPEDLQAQFSRGEARIIEESSLVGRAVDRLVDSMANANRAPL